jgi:GAF domain-containing protein
MVADGEFELPTWAALPARPNAAFDALARTLAERLSAPMAFVILVSKGGQVFPGAFGLPEWWDARRSTPLSGSPSQQIARTGRSLAIRDVREDPELRDSAVLRRVNAVGYVGAVVPDDQGGPLGVLCAIDVRPRSWSAAEVALVERLAAECSRELQVQSLGLAEREAQAAAERAAAAAQQTARAAQAAFQEAEAEADRARAVARLGAALVGVQTLQDVLDTVDRLVRSPLGAATAVLGIAETGTSLLRAYCTGPVASGRRPGVLDLDDDDHPLAVVVRERRPVALVGWEGADRLLTARDADPHGGAALALPLLLGHHASSGGLLLHWSGRRELDPALRAVTADLATQLGLALDRVLLTGARRRLERSPSPSAASG